ncbi:MAG: phosphate/phosphite/phosphonate ABC transporter substrate-binding protein [Planctomycetaceae bacterium]|nr:phosphate/phosphite/phosphonate ABC transporter substrate-binding protein [Planctomycetaceae bacterium]
MLRRTFVLGVGTSLLTVPFLAAEKSAPLVIAVMDPFALDLACSCVKGFSQRKYNVLAGHLRGELGRPVTCVFSGSLRPTFSKSPTGRIDLVIGKDDVVRHEARSFKLEIEPLAKLTDLEGKTTHHGVFVVEKSDPAQTLGDLASYKILFGPEYSAERRIEPVKMLRSCGVTVPDKPDFRVSDKDAALEILDNEDPDTRICATLSAHALKLMEGCQTIEKGALRLLEQTPEVPFITVFAAKTLGQEAVKKIRNSLFTFGKNEKNLAALESKSGFVAYEEKGIGNRESGIE